MSKYQGIDQRQIKCCDPSPKSIEAGISFDSNLSVCKLLSEKTRPLQTKTMWLDKQNIDQLIKELQEIRCNTM